jgi:quercetin dioxygenase-like cupin family protein
MEWACGNVYIRPNQGNKGDKIKGHAHNFDHTTICLRGAVRIKAGDVKRELRAASGDVAISQAHVLIKAGVEHDIEFLEDNSVFWCVYSHRTPQGDIVQEYTGWDKAYT